MEVEKEFQELMEGPHPSDIHMSHLQRALSSTLLGGASASRPQMLANQPLPAITVAPGVRSRLVPFPRPLRGQSGNQVALEGSMSAVSDPYQGGGRLECCVAANGRECNGAY